MLTTWDKRRKDKTTPFGVDYEKPSIRPLCPDLTTGHLYSIGKSNARQDPFEVLTCHNLSCGCLYKRVLQHCQAIALF